jgi:histidinol phosphatase-like PHP family hydrolase
MKQTAVQWLRKELETIPNYSTFYTNNYQWIDSIMNEAKEMEKKQLCYFYIKGVEAEMNNPYITNIEFYNKTFKNK